MNTDAELQAARYLGTALGGALRVTLTAAEVEELWNETDEDLRERDDDGSVTLWARGVDHPARLAPLYFHPIEQTAA